jgi:hypothetical protein
MSTISDLQRMLKEYKHSNPYGYSNLKKKYTRRDNVLLKSGYYNNQAWGALIKCWKGFKIAKNDGDEENMIHYAEGIQKYQCELGLDIEDFSRLGLCAPSSPGHEVMEEQHDANDRATHDDSPNSSDKAKGEEYEFDNYEDYVSSSPMGIEPISEDEFYKRHNSNNR